MISVLIVDDSPDKVDLITEAIKETVGHTADVRAVGTVQNGFFAMRDGHFDLLILDMQIPRRAGEEPIPDGGLQLLDLLRRGRAQFPTHIVGLSEYDDLVAKYGASFSGELMYLVKFDRSSKAWSDAIARKLLAIERSKAAPEAGGYDYDIAIVTALHHVELEAVLALPADWTERSDSADDTIYHEGSFRRSGQSALRVIAAAAPEMGMAAATALAMKISLKFRPRYLVMVGIAAGIDAAAGDILIADTAWDYGSGKVVESSTGAQVFKATPNQITINPRLRTRLAHFIMSPQKVCRPIQARWSGTWPPNELGVRIGPMASGAAVVDSPSIVATIRQQHNKTIGFEMETYGVFMAARLCPEPRPLVFSVKSAADRGVGKTDEYQRLAAFSSATFLFDFAVTALEFNRG